MIHKILHAALSIKKWNASCTIMVTGLRSKISINSGKIKLCGVGAQNGIMLS